MDHEKVGPLDRALELILSLDAMAPAPNLPDQLNGLFEDLAKPELDEPLDVVEGSIWALWCSHPDDSAVQQMERVIGGLAQGRFDAAERLLDGLVRDYPDWAEAWNKRATLYFLLDRDDESVADIEETLKLEPSTLWGLGRIWSDLPAPRRAGDGQNCLREGAGSQSASRRCARDCPRTRG